MISVARPDELCTVAFSGSAPEPARKNYLAESHRRLLDKIIYYEFQILMVMINF